MNEPLNLKGKKFISAKRAAEISGYASDYIGQLSRMGKIEARMVGRTWFVSEESLKNHKRIHSIPHNGEVRVFSGPTSVQTEKVPASDEHSDSDLLSEELEVSVSPSDTVGKFSDKTSDASLPVHEAFEPKQISRADFFSALAGNTPRSDLSEHLKKENPLKKISTSLSKNTFSNIENTLSRSQPIRLHLSSALQHGVAILSSIVLIAGGHFFGKTEMAMALYDSLSPRVSFVSGKILDEGNNILEKVEIGASSVADTFIKSYAVVESGLSSISQSLGRSFASIPSVVSNFVTSSIVGFQDAISALAEAPVNGFHVTARAFSGKISLVRNFSESLARGLITLGSAPKVGLSLTYDSFVSFPSTIRPLADILVSSVSVLGSLPIRGAELFVLETPAFPSTLQAFSESLAGSIIALGRGVASTLSSAVSLGGDAFEQVASVAVSNTSRVFSSLPTILSFFSISYSSSPSSPLPTTPTPPLSETESTLNLTPVLESTSESAPPLEIAPVVTP